MPRARLDVEHGADVVTRCQHKLLVQRPFGLVVQARGRVQVHHLVVLDRQVVARALQVRDLPPARRLKSLDECGRVRLAAGATSSAHCPDDDWRL